MPQVRILSPRCDQKPVPSWCLNRPARGGFLLLRAAVGRAGVKNGLPTHGQEAQNALRRPLAVNRGFRAQLQTTATAKAPEPPGQGNPPSGGAQLSTANLLKLVSRWGRTRTTSTHTQPRLTCLLVRREV